MSDEAMQELGELAGVGPRKVVLKLRCGDILLYPPSLASILEIERSNVQEGTLEHSLLVLWHGAKRAGYKRSLEEFTNTMDTDDEPNIMKAAVELCPPHRRTVVKEALERLLEMMEEEKGQAAEATDREIGDASSGTS
jgi:hypothetical protein